MKKFLLLALSLFAVSSLPAQVQLPGIPSAAAAKAPSQGDRILGKAFKSGRSEFMVKFKATVIAILPDDLEGSRHQRFLVKLKSGQTLLVVHNIDLAPRVRNLKYGHQVNAHGEYIWNSKGGLIHKTHLDPGNDDPHGWIRHKGKIYQ